MWDKIIYPSLNFNGATESGNEYKIAFVERNYLLAIGLLIHAGIKVNPCE